MAANPSPEVLAALQAAARQTNVPLSLLWGVAFAESGFDPSKIGPVTSSGQAQGLMQLMPAIAAAYGVTEPLDARQSALGGAKLLAKLGKALKWNWEAMLSAYVWGPTNYARAKANPGTPMPGDVMTYVRRALAARDVYRNKADRPHGTLIEALNAAIENLAELNPTWAPAIMARDAWRPFFAAHKTDTDVEALISQPLKAQFRGYELAYERAPITDESTPAPELVRPDLWKSAAEAVERVKTRVSDAAEGVALGLGGGLFLLALFWVAVSSDRRR